MNFILTLIILLSFIGMCVFYPSPKQKRRKYKRKQYKEYKNGRIINMSADPTRTTNKGR